MDMDIGSRVIGSRLAGSILLFSFVACSLPCCAFLLPTTLTCGGDPAATAVPQSHTALEEA
eukprot:8672975-Karenia_brevis.AAC.1